MSEEESHAIFSQTQLCWDLFQKLTSKHDPGSEAASMAQLTQARQQRSQEARRTAERFEKWCRASGAGSRGPQSLDERLRDALKIKKLVLETLGGVLGALREAENQAEERDKGVPSKLPEATESGEGITVEALDLDRLLSAVIPGGPLDHANSMIDILFRVIVAIRPTLSPDRYSKAQTVKLPDEDFFLTGDGAQLSKLFPALNPELKEKLLSASIQRRRILGYVHEYREKFKFERRQEAGPVADGSVLDVPLIPDRLWGRETDSDSIISRAQSTLSISELQRRPKDTSDDVSETSSISTTFRSPRYKVPPFPEDPDEHIDDLRTCIACYLLLPLPDEKVWKSHILQDIRPYICTFTDCSIDPGKLYSNRRAWFEHELTFHRRRWDCPYGCADALLSAPNFKAHLISTHGQNIDSASAALSFARRREIGSKTETTCPFCSKLIKSRAKIKSHIASHQEQIALMALSSMRDIDYDSEIEDSDEGEEAGHRPLPESSAPKHPGPRARSPEDSELIDTESKLDMELGTLEGAETRKIRKLARTVTFGPEESRDEVQPIYRKDSLATRAWVLMPGLDYPFEEEGSFRLGQVLRHPRDTRECLERDEILPINKSRIRHTVVRDWQILQSAEDRILAISRLIWGNRPGKPLSKFSIRAESMQSFTFRPSQEYIQALLRIPLVAELMASTRSQNPFSSSRKLYLVTGLRVVSHCEIHTQVRREEGVNMKASVAAVSGPFRVEAGYRRNTNNFDESSLRVERPVIFAYSLLEIRRSWLGNLMLTVYEKGDIA